MTITSKPSKAQLANMKRLGTEVVAYGVLASDGASSVPVTQEEADRNGFSLMPRRTCIGLVDVGYAMLFTAPAYVRRVDTADNREYDAAFILVLLTHKGMSALGI